MRRLLEATAILASCVLLSAVWVPSAATCASSHLISSCGASCGGVCSYIQAPGASPASLAGSFWAFGAGNPAIGIGHDNGADLPVGNPDPSNNWILDFGGQLYIAGNWATSGVDGCIDGVGVPPPKRTVIALSDQTVSGNEGYFALECVQVTGSEYDFCLGGADLILAPVPPALVTNAVPGSGSVSVTVQGPTLASAAAGIRGDGSAPASALVLGYKVYVQVASAGASDPPNRRRTAGWSLVTPVYIPIGGSTTFSINCSASQAVFLASSLVFESGYETLYLSRTFGLAYYDDLDGDGYGAPGVMGYRCVPPAQAAARDGDCNDSSFAVNPAAPEICNGVDDNCDGQAECNGSPCVDTYACTTSDTCVSSVCSGFPCQVAGLVLTSPSSIQWSATQGADGYDIVRSDDDPSFASASTCLVSGHGPTNFTDSSTPAFLHVFYYVVRAQNGLGAGLWGLTSSSQAIVPATPCSVSTCPAASTNGCAGYAVGHACTNASSNSGTCELSGICQCSTTTTCAAGSVPGCLGSAAGSACSACGQASGTCKPYGDHRRCYCG